MGKQISSTYLPTEEQVKKYNGKYPSKKHPGWCKFCKRKASDLCDNCELVRGEPQHFKAFPGIDNIPAGRIGVDVERDDSSNWRG